MKQKLIKQAIELYTQANNRSSKWFEQDLSEFKRYINSKTEKELVQQVANMNALVGNDPRFNALVDKEEKRLYKAGMYNIDRMKPGNALD